MTDERKPGMIGGLAMIIFGIIWLCVTGGETSSTPAWTPYSRPTGVLVAVGVLFIAGGVIVSGRELLKTRESEEQQQGTYTYESFDYDKVKERTVKETRDEKEELVNRVIAAVREQNVSREKTIVYCPYCGTAQDGDYRICGSCGAGRNGKK